MSSVRIAAKAGFVRTVHFGTLSAALLCSDNPKKTQHIDVVLLT